VKKYQRAAGNELDTFLLRNNKVKSQPELFTEVYDVKGNAVDPKDIKRINEMTGAGIEYATSLVEYVCTHHRDYIKHTDSNLYYETYPIEWAAALEIMTGGLTGQRARAAREILRLHAKPKPVLIKRKDGRFTSMQPFVLAFDWGKPETLDARAATNLARMQKGAEELAKKREVETSKKENRPADIENIERPDLLPIEKITVQFSKPLFEDLFMNGGNTYSFPAGMYAKMFHYAQLQQKTLDLLRKNGSPYSPQDYISDILSKFSDLNEPYIPAFARFARYIVRHNNLTASQMKNKNHYSRMNIPLLNMASEVYPSAVSKNGRGERWVEMPKIKRFLDMVLLIYYQIDSFLFYPAIVKLTQDTLTIDIYTDAKKAEKALGLDTARG
jgi:hypothetical protein